MNKKVIIGIDCKLANSVDTHTGHVSRWQIQQRRVMHSMQQTDEIVLLFLIDNNDTIHKMRRSVQ